MKSKLADPRFKSDERTGAIVVYEGAVSFGKMKESGGGAFGSTTPKRCSTWDEMGHVPEENAGFGRRRGYGWVGSSGSEDLVRLTSATGPR